VVHDHIHHDLQIVPRQSLCEARRSKVGWMRWLGGNYQTLINYALCEYIQNCQDPLEKTLRRVVREALHSME
jgi:hypothetical protein